MRHRVIRGHVGRRGQMVAILDSMLLLGFRFVTSLTLNRHLSYYSDPLAVAVFALTLIFCRLIFFFLPKSALSKKYSRANSYDLEQARRFVGLVLGSYCL